MIFEIEVYVPIWEPVEKHLFDLSFNFFQPFLRVYIKRNIFNVLEIMDDSLYENVQIKMYEYDFG